MPIRPELRQFYSGATWQATRLRILARAKDCCEQCGKPNGRRVWVYRSLAYGQYWTLGLHEAQYWIYCLSGAHGSFRLIGRQIIEAMNAGQLRVIRVVLTIAHLNHTPGDDRDENLKALCQWCHLNQDKLHHKETRSARKDRKRPLLAESLAQGGRLAAAGGKDL